MSARAVVIVVLFAIDMLAVSYALVGHQQGIATRIEAAEHHESAGSLCRLAAVQSKYLTCSPE